VRTQVKTHTFATGCYRIVHESLDGLCLPIAPAVKQISIRHTLKGAALLETLIHEALHAEGETDERWVSSAARRITRLLRRYGYRLPEEES